jgi:hypothetical protein
MTRHQGGKWGLTLVGGKMADVHANGFKRAPWKVDVLDRLSRVEEDVKRAISVKGWALHQNRGAAEQDGAGRWIITPADGQRPRLMNQADAVVATTFDYVEKTRESLGAAGWWQRPREWLSGALLMSAYTSLHAAEANRVLILSGDQLAAILPSIRARAAAYLAVGDPRRVALDGVPDLTAPAHQALARVQGALVRSVAHAEAPAAPPPRRRRRQRARGRAPAPAPAQAQDPGFMKLTDMLGSDQEIAAAAMSEACKAEDLEQSQVRSFRSVLLGTFLGLFILVVILGIVGAAHPAYFPLCWKQSTGKMICPSGGSAPSSADVPLILALGGVGAALAVALNLAGLKPVGVRYSLSVAQGLLKIAFGAITAMLGIIIVRTQSSVSGFLGSQAGLLTAAVVFGYSQQLFTRLIDRQASSLMKAASPATPPSVP